MSKLSNLETRVPQEYTSRPFMELFRLIQDAVNALSEGRIVQHYNGLITAPTTGSWKQGDFVKNTAPVEAGAVASKYTIGGWRCVASGSPGTWVESRNPTGN